MTGKPSPQTRAILTPLVDLLCCGGLSIFVVVAFFVLMLVDPGNAVFSRSIELRDVVILGFLINFPHFMASYRILYRKKSQIVEHSWAAIYVPLVLIALSIYALLTPSQNPENPEFANGAIVEFVTLISVFLLAWHYTGQAWGMIASFAFISGLRMDDLERKLIRSGCYALMVQHVLFALIEVAFSSEQFLLCSSLLFPWKELLFMLFLGWWAVSIGTIGLGVWGFVRLAKRTGKSIPYRALVPWVALYAWYALISFQPGLFICLQMFHALQYLIFPIRVEVNQRQQTHQTETADGPSSPAKPSGRHVVAPAVWQGTVYYLALVAVGFVVFGAPHLLRWVNEEAFLAVNVLLLSFINIHHYVIDGAIWKIRNPDVRRDLFAHLRSAS